MIRHWSNDNITDPLITTQVCRAAGDDEISWNRRIIICGSIMLLNSFRNSMKCYYNKVISIKLKELQRCGGCLDSGVEAWVRFTVGPTWELFLIGSDPSVLHIRGCLYPAVYRPMMNVLRSTPDFVVLVFRIFSGMRPEMRLFAPYIFFIINP